MGLPAAFRCVPAALLLTALLGACGESPPVTAVESPPTPGAGPQPAPVLVEHRIDSELINESSGLARSQRRGDVLWTLNDSGGATELYALSTEGRLLATLRIQGVPANLDWEDLTSFRRGDAPFLLIGDIGDNNAFRPFVTLYLVAEPEFEPGATPQTLSVTPTTVYTLMYPDGPRDAESLAVDGGENAGYILSKRDAQPALYRFPLDSTLPAAAPAVMEKLGAIHIPRAPDGYAGPGNVDSFNWTTAMDFADDGRRAYVGSLVNGYFYDRADGESWFQAFSKPPRSFDLPDYPQIEAGTFALGSRDTVYITSEQLPAPLAQLRP